MWVVFEKQTSFAFITFRSKKFLEWLIVIWVQFTEILLDSLRFSTLLPAASFTMYIGRQEMSKVSTLLSSYSQYFNKYQLKGDTKKRCKLACNCRHYNCVLPLEGFVWFHNEVLFHFEFDLSMQPCWFALYQSQMNSRKRLPQALKSAGWKLRTKHHPDLRSRSRSNQVCYERTDTHMKQRLAFNSCSFWTTKDSYSDVKCLEMYTISYSMM